MQCRGRRNCHVFSFARFAARKLDPEFPFGFARGRLSENNTSSRHSRAFQLVSSISIGASSSPEIISHGVEG
jgi:hypothetical protein